MRLEERLGYTAQGHRGADGGRDIGPCGQARGTDFRRQHRRLFDRIRPRGRGGARHRHPCPRALAAGADGGNGADRQSPRRYRRDLQRRVIRDHACPLRRAARARPASADACFGHRLMMDIVVPGGVAGDLGQAGADAVRQLLTTIRETFPQLVALYDNTASLQDRTVGTGRLSSALAHQFGCGGFVGRGSGRAFDARRNFSYPPYDELQFDVPVLSEGDVNARLWVRIREVEESLRLIDRILDAMPPGEIRVEITEAGETCEALALVEGFRGDILCWLRLDPKGLVERCHFRDPSWFQWPVLEAAVEGNIVADFPLCNKSFNCSYSGHDL